MSQKTRSSEQPSILAASISSVGSVWMNWRIRKTPNGAREAGRDQPEVGVDQAEARHQREQRDQEREAGNHHRADVQPEDDFAPGKLLLGEAVAGHRGEEELEGGHRQRHDQAVERPAQDRRVGEGLAKVVERDARAESTPAAGS